ncbi:hypothetical protein [Streptomyces hiroshimensis]|uniref:Uncharacterized protein n=1 Tax=Streptomyces hiroshimensis TaxID=66424 RepID=A0ABQ2YK75_9ACTN|nr:hypothetical protein [Streptomyces hiroshimensis]GGX86995.1 hypothetical protein GCM10010324_35620 [Streptomyces hiroshimensis]
MENADQSQDKERHLADEAKHPRPGEKARTKHAEHVARDRVKQTKEDAEDRASEADAKTRDPRE